jgi:hypothetical protein
MCFFEVDGHSCVILPGNISLGKIAPASESSNLRFKAGELVNLQVVNLVESRSAPILGYDLLYHVCSFIAFPRCHYVAIRRASFANASH